MQRTSLDHMRCSIARTVDLIGEWWTPLILRDLFLGLTKFEDIRRDLGIASNVLTVRLERLLEHDIVERRQYQDAPARYEYMLTEKGHDLFPVIAVLTAYGDRWLAGPEGPPALMIHQDCGLPAAALTVCNRCGGEMTSKNVHAIPGPGSASAQP